MVNRLEQMGFNDTGNLTNAYSFEKIEILALAMYYKLRRYDPSDRFVQTQKNKILSKYKMNSEEKLDIKKTLYKMQLYTQYEQQDRKQTKK